MVFVTYQNSKIRMPVDQNGRPLDHGLHYSTGGLCHFITSDDEHSVSADLVINGFGPQQVFVYTTQRPCWIKFYSATNFSIEGAAFDTTGSVDGENALTLVGAFSDYTWESGDTVEITSVNTGSVAVTDVSILSKVDSDTILLDGEVNTSNADDSDVDADIKKTPAGSTTEPASDSLYFLQGESRLFTLPAHLNKVSMRGAVNGTASICIVNCMGQHSGTMG